jgi:deoxyribose-phosphate aldolase
MARASARVDAVMLESRAALLAARSIEAESKVAGIDLLIGCLDLTTLEGHDTESRVRALCARAAAPGDGAPSVAAVCVYPALVTTACKALAGSGVRVASVAGAFPAGLSPLEIKLAEARSAIAAGAGEIDIVIDRAALLAGREDEARKEIEAFRDAFPGVTLKVILETGELGSYHLVRRASEIALEAGADFLKTSTGKIAVSATPAVALLLCEAIGAHFRRTGRAVGLKLAGGVRSTRAALGYVSVVKETLGDAWLHPSRLRLGASTLLDDLLQQRASEVRAS